MKSGVFLTFLGKKTKRPKTSSGGKVQNRGFLRSKALFVTLGKLMLPAEHLMETNIWNMLRRKLTKMIRYYTKQYNSIMEHSLSKDFYTDKEKQSEVARSIHTKSEIPVRYGGL